MYKGFYLSVCFLRQDLLKMFAAGNDPLQSENLMYRRKGDKLEGEYLRR